MNVLFLNNFYYLRGGSERVLFEEMRMLRNRGHRVAIFARANKDNEPSDYERFFPPEIETERLSVAPRAFYTFKEVIYSDKARAGLRKVIDEFRPDIAHAHNIYGRLSVSVLDELKERHIPIVLTLHDLKLLCPSYLMLSQGKVCEKCEGKKFYHAVLSRCHKNSYVASAIYALETWMNHYFQKYEPVKFFVSPSQFLRKKHIQFGWNPERFIHLPNFMNTGQLKASGEVGGYLLYFGRLSREKGIRTLLQAFSQLRSRNSLVIAGDGPERNSLEEFAIKQGVNVSFTGYQTTGPLRETVSKAKAVVMPSECYENFPLSLLESFAHGKPVIGSRIGGIPEMIEDGVDGYLFEPGNVDDLRDKLELMLSKSSKDIEEMGRAARSKVETEYSAELHYERLMELYHRALSKS